MFRVVFKLPSISVVWEIFRWYDCDFNLGINERLQLELEKQLNRSVNIISSTEAYCVAWLGGAIFAGLSDAKKMWVTQRQYEEHGVKIIKNKFMWLFTYYYAFDWDTASFVVCFYTSETFVSREFKTRSARPGHRRRWTDRSSYIVAKVYLDQTMKPHRNQSIYIGATMPCTNTRR